MSLKKFVKSLWGALAVFFFVAGWAPDALAAPVIDVTPATITEMTKTNVTVTVTGVAPGGTAVLEKWVDANRNGYKDSADILLGYVSVTDGVLDQNPNVPGDSDQLPNGTISTVFNYHALNSSHLPGYYLYRVVSGGLSDDVAFQISATPTAQSISGNVAVNGGAAVPGAFVFLYHWGMDIDLVGSIADASGNFQIYLPSEFAGEGIGVYAFYPGDTFYSGGLGDVPATVAAGEHKGGVNLKLYPQGPYVISGYLRDAVTAAGIPGVWVDAESLGQEYLSVSDLTDENGYYELHVPSGIYEVGSWPDTLSIGSVLSRGYVGYDYLPEVSVSTANVNNIDIYFHKASVLLTGKVLDLNGNPVSGYTVEAYNWQDPSESASETVSNSDGSYTLGVRSIEGYPQWQIEGAWDEDNLVNLPYIADNFSFSPLTDSLNRNLLVQPHTAWVNGHALYNDSTQANNAWIYAHMPNGSWFHGAETGDATGDFILPLAVGEWVFGSGSNSCMSAVFVEEGQTSVEVLINVNGNAFDACNNDLDSDGDLNFSDNCPATYNPSQADIDSNGIGDACDTADYDSDGLVDYLEIRGGTGVSNPDSDGDGLQDGIDTQPLVYQTPLNDNTAFVRQVYLDFLNREPDVAGLQYWAGELTAGRRIKAQVVEEYLLSTEFQGKIAPVARLYFAYFNRIPDYNGLMYWVNEYASGNRTLNDISDFFAVSDEFQTTYGSLNNAQFVNLVYLNVLGRAADPGGLAYWTNELDTAAKTRGQVMTGFSESNEYQTLMSSEVYVTMTYIGLMRRSPDQGGYNYWVGQMDGGRSGQDLINGFLVSPEYQGRFTTP